MVYEHGGDVYRNKVRLDFSVNTNPLGMSENVKKAIAENIEQFGIYPDAMCVNLRNAIADKEQVGADNVRCSNGAAEMICAVVCRKKHFCWHLHFRSTRGRLKAWVRKFAIII